MTGLTSLLKSLILGIARYVSSFRKRTLFTETSIEKRIRHYFVFTSSVRLVKKFGRLVICRLSDTFLFEYI